MVNVAAKTTYDTPATTGAMREDLTDIIYNISPTATPFMSNCGRESVKSTFHEWQTDVLDTAVSTNAAVEGADAVDTSFTAPARVGNYTQISTKTIDVSGTSGAVDLAGMKTLEAYLLAKRAKELKRDMEKTLCANTAAAAGSANVSTGARNLAGFPAWITTNTVILGNAVAPTLSGTTYGYPNAAWTTLTGATALTEANLQSAIQKLWTNGGDPKMAMVGPVNKKRISGFEGIAAIRVNAEKAKQTFILGAADVYVSDFGNVDIVPNRFNDEAYTMLIDPSYAKIGYLRNFRRIPLAVTGDSKRTQLLVEYTLVIGTEKAHAIVANQTTS
jgi:hypothetical protein